jgi:hypothetical protein
MFFERLHLTFNYRIGEYEKKGGPKAALIPMRSLRGLIGPDRHCR